VAYLTHIPWIDSGERQQISVRIGGSLLRFKPRAVRMRVSRVTTVPAYSETVEFEVLTAVSTNMAVFWVVAPCSLVEVHQSFRGPCCLHHQGDE
jgi:hypothetical protein